MLRFGAIVSSYEYAAVALTGFGGPGFECRPSACPDGRWRISGRRISGRRISRRRSFRHGRPYARPRNQAGLVEWLFPAAFWRPPPPWIRNIRRLRRIRGRLVALWRSVLGRR